MANPNELSWTYYQDIQLSEEEIRKQFNHYISNGQYTEAINVLRTQKTQLKGRAYVAEAINEIIRNMLSLEGYYDNGVRLFLSDLAVQYAELVNNFRSRGTWNNSVEYRPYNFVLYRSDIYMAISTSKVGVPPADNEYWLKLGLMGEMGAPGIDVSVKFQWGELQQYKARDLVSYNNDLYVAVKDNKGVVPGTDDSTWLPFLIVARGKINVGPTAPVNPIENTIWIQTSVDPITVEQDAVGDMFRSRRDGTWEPMYSSTIFTLIEGHDLFAPIKTTARMSIEPNQWGVLNGVYVAKYKSNKITSTSVVIIGCNLIETLEEFQTYSDLDLEINDGEVIFKIAYRPRVLMHLFLSIQ